MFGSLKVKKGEWKREKKIKHVRVVGEGENSKK